MATPINELAHAQSADGYPLRVVTMIVPFEPGAGTDIEGRIYSNKLREALGQSFVLDYKPGPSMNVGMNRAARQKPDGYTLLFVSASNSLLPLVFKNLAYDPIKNFEPISLLSKGSKMPAHGRKPRKTLCRISCMGVLFATRITLDGVAGLAYRASAFGNASFSA